MTDVGFTALAAAAGRAVETSRPDRLAVDPFAADFVAAAHPPVPLPTRWPDEGAELTQQEVLLLLGANYVGLRTRFFDDRLVGARQVVLLGAGLDTRAFRLAWPDGAVVFELDQPAVLEFKASVLTAPPRCTRVPVGVDLARDWAAALLAAGFDRSAPTAWLAEGLLQYLSPAAENALVTAVDALSAPGSALAVERALDLGDPARLREGAERAGVRVDRLVRSGPRDDLAAWLRDRGWHARDVPLDEVAAHYDRPLLHPRLVGDLPPGARQPTPAGFTTATKDA
ncbi:SAM-dependent methyltransferase [Saccharothrix syringae]|uniref:S-adenosyl-L-methionine-dependent methyltransferase n=1 Tax=Saccharothrix syringae TaxID=103733 RepID=A0A5Q0H170_SACSY|nr:SAM-dependent methyltransferase [Saccharothrix syringae]QFZ20011.1 SAM-dependent methyltransferase [Saccharothrix syringae]